MKTENRTPEKIVELENNKALVLLSGGLDSSTALYWAKSQGYDVMALSVNYYRRPPKEREGAKYMCERLGVRNIEIPLPFVKEIDDLRDFDFPLPALDQSPPGYIPVKNLMFYSIAAYFAELYGINTFVGGQIKSDNGQYPDASPKFFSALSGLIKKSTVTHKKRGLAIEFPFVELEKPRVVQKALELGVPLKRTWSCYEDQEVPCEICKGCEERKKAFDELGVKDPLFDA